MLYTKYVLMFVVLSTGMLTGLTATGMSQAQTAFADDQERVCENNSDNNCNDVKQKTEQENKCKNQNENSNERDSDDNSNTNAFRDQINNCWNHDQDAGRDANAQDDAFSGLHNSQNN